jgi:hypothetical protein
VCPCSLDSIENTTNRSGVFKVRAEEPAVHEKRIGPLEAAMRSLKTQQSGRAEARTAVST